MLNILYIGPNDSEWAQMNRPVSLAAAKWARGFLGALSKVANVTALTHTYEIAWPKGKVFWRGYDKRLYNEGVECVSISYPVVKFIREFWLRHAYSRKARQIIFSKRIDVVLLYNCDEWLAKVIRSIRVFSPEVKIIPFILDGNDPRKDDWKWIKEAARYSDAMVALSWWVYENIPVKAGCIAYHFDGGADCWRGVKPLPTRESNDTRPFRLVHTGALDKWRGLDIMIDIVNRMAQRRKDVKFIFCGKSSAKVLESVFRGNPQIELPGFLTEKDMVSLCNSADILLNVRDPENPDNILNYPSKLPHYLSFGRPIVSTRLKSLSPEYDDVVCFPSDGKDDPIEAFLEKIDEVLAWGGNRRICEYNKIHRWFEQRKTWNIMVSNLIQWIEQEVM